MQWVKNSPLCFNLNFCNYLRLRGNCSFCLGIEFSLTLGLFKQTSLIGKYFLLFGDQECLAQTEGQLHKVRSPWQRGTADPIVPRQDFTECIKAP